MSKNGDDSKQKVSTILVFLLLIAACVSIGSAAELSIENLALSGSGSSDSSALILDSAPYGVWGFKINASMIPTGVARIVGVSFPSAFSWNSNTTLPADQVRVLGLDMSRAAVPAGSTNVTLCTFTLQGVTEGSTELVPSIFELTDDNGNAIEPTVKNGTITVGSVSPTPTPTATTTATPTPTTTATATPTVSPTVSPTTTTTTTPTVTPTATTTATPTPTPVPLVANFTATPMTGVPPLSVQFVDRSEGNPAKWRWNFGDGVYSTVMNPQHVYGGIGRYTVTLEVENDDNTTIQRKTEYIKTTKK